MTYRNNEDAGDLTAAGAAGASEARMENYLDQINKEIDKLTGGQGLTTDDFADTIFFWDYLDDGVPAEDAAMDILDNDTIGQQFLDLM